MTYTDPAGLAHVATGAYALRYAVMVQENPGQEWGFWATSRTYQGAWKRLAEAKRRGGFGPGNSAIVEGQECSYCAPDEPCALHTKIGGTE